MRSSRTMLSMGLWSVLAALSVGAGLGGPAGAQQVSRNVGKSTTLPALEFEIGQAPLGLTWRVSVEDTRKTGVQLDAVNSSVGEAVFQAKVLPRNLDDARMVLLGFGFDNRLRQIVVIGNDQANDPRGEKLRARYQELLIGLEQKYGKARSSHKLATGQAKEDFLQSLKDKRSSWSSICDNGRIVVLLSLSATDAQTGHWAIAYDDKALTAAFHTAVKTKTRGAL